jgi:hypothetical protein
MDAVVREFFSQGGVPDTSSPYVLRNMGRFATLSFVATTITKVAASVDGTTFLAISALKKSSSPSGSMLFSDLCFVQYRITFTGDLFVNAN